MESKYSELSSSLAPEKVLQQFVANLEHPVNQMIGWSIILQKSAELNEQLKITTHIHEEAEAMLEYIHSIINYLRERPKSEVNKVREEENLNDLTEISINSLPTHIILSRFTHELRHPMTVIVGYSSYYQKPHLGQDKRQKAKESLIEAIEYVKRMYMWLRSQLEN